MTERFREFAAEWGLAELPDYLARVAMPLFDENDPRRRPRGLHVVRGENSAAVGMLERTSEQGLASGRQTRVLLASIGMGRITVERHIGLGLGYYLKCVDSCYTRTVTATAITAQSFGAPQEYDVRPRAGDVTAHVQQLLIADLSALVSAPSEQDLFTGEAAVQGSFMSLVMAAEMDRHTFEPELEAARAQLHMPHAS
jgi:hypothetical protein